MKLRNFKRRLMAFSARVFVFSAFVCISSQGSAQGSAADLDGLSSVGWPLGTPMSCASLTRTIAKSLDEAVTTIRRQCSEQNRVMEENGFAACGQDECLDAFVMNAQGRDWGTLKLKLGRSEWTNQVYVTLTYSSPTSTTQPLSRMVCFDPKLKAEELLQDELSRWDFQRFVEFCVKPPAHPRAG
jgi:hypothetical protein